MDRWLSIVGIGEDGLAGLGERARALIDRAEVLVGGERHLAMVPEDGRPRLNWSEGLDAGIAAVAEQEGKAVCVLATGDPLNFGIGKRLVERFGIDATEIVPTAGAFAMLAARMGWSLNDGMVRTVSCHAFPIEVLNRHLLPGLKLLILARNGETPAQAAALLTERGFGDSAMTVFEHMGGPDEGRYDTMAEEWEGHRVKDLNVIALHLWAKPDAQVWPETPGLPEEAFRHDGKITKREVRAATLARLAPMPGQLLWDIGAGSGAVAIEWLRAAPGTRAVAIERAPDRHEDIEANASNLGVPQLILLKGDAPDCLAEAGDPPDAVFVGGGLSRPGVIEAGLEALKPGGRLVANAVTLEAQQILMQHQKEHGGELTRIAVARSGRVGEMTAMRPLMEVLQWTWTKPGAVRS
ncbi:MAG TPA: cobalamin biosynthesis bifunctional protein CbiET [Rhodospirillaceae bacterium]|nr:cobalamin biosynthesis bifunctional protein CbiET [Rhodospirillaceae bacterium]|tara:strand:- start:3234 stop:4463 length:1230 start_codon:yes stop_codon:yes gene_type:complete